MTDRPAAAATQAALESWVDEGLYSSLFGIVLQGSSELWFGGAGRTVVRESIFDLASITKLVTATLALRLDDDKIGRAHV